MLRCRAGAEAAGRSPPTRSTRRLGAAYATTGRHEHGATTRPAGVVNESDSETRVDSATDGSEVSGCATRYDRYADRARPREPRETVPMLVAVPAIVRVSLQSYSNS